MITVDTCGTTAYSPLIPAIKAICEAPFGEIYDGEYMTIQFVIK